MEGEVDLDKRNAAIAKAWKIVRDDILIFLYITK